MQGIYRKCGVLAVLFILSISIAAGRAWADAPAIPKPEGWVNDFAGVIDSESQAKLNVMDGDSLVQLPRKRRFIFDRPFLLALKQADARVPYFLLWVGNTELLLPPVERRPERH